MSNTGAASLPHTCNGTTRRSTTRPTKQSPPNSAAMRGGSALDEAKEFLKEQLADGPVPANDVKEATTASGRER